MKTTEKRQKTAAAAILLGALLLSSDLGAEQSSEKDLALRKAEYMSVVKEGQTLFTVPMLGRNEVVCAQCHPDAASTHPETYPKFKKQLGRVVTIGEMINWCIANPLEGERLALESPKMTALITYITDKRRGVPLEPGKQ